MNEVDHELADTSHQDNAATARTTPRPIWTLARDACVKFKPPAFGLPSLDHALYGWKPHANTVLLGCPNAEASDLALTLAEKFATSGGQVVWIGVGSNFPGITERLVLRDAGIVVPNGATSIILDVADQRAVINASGRIGALPINYCNLDEACDEVAVQDFLVRVTSDAPTLIIVEPSVFGNSPRLDPFEILVRRCNLDQLVDSLKVSNADWRVLWQIPMTTDAVDWLAAEALAKHDESVLIESADVVMFTRCPEDASRLDEAEVVITKNRFGPLTALSLRYAPELSSWSERT